MSFDNMGKPISTDRRDAGFHILRQIGVPRVAAFHCVERVANSLERDEPYEAMAEAQKDVDLCGAYMLLAHLLTPAARSAS